MWATQLFAFALCLACIATPALAYIGPGAGVTVLGALWGIVAAVFLAMTAILVWPIRSFFRRRRKARAAASDQATIEAQEGGEASGARDRA